MLYLSLNKNDFTILVVDDDFINRTVLKHMLRGIQVRVEYAENGKEAVDYIDAHLKDKIIVLLDINMPVMNGYEVIQYLKDDPEKYTNTSIIVLSGSNPAELEYKGFKNDIFCYLSKPVNKDELIEQIITASI
jgi:CheY-like chemotaxis protein